MMSNPRRLRARLAYSNHERRCAEKKNKIAVVEQPVVTEAAARLSSERGGAYKTRTVFGSTSGSRISPPTASNARSKCPGARRLHAEPGIVLGRQPTAQRTQPHPSRHMPSRARIARGIP